MRLDNKMYRFDDCAPQQFSLDRGEMEDEDLVEADEDDYDEDDDRRDSKKKKKKKRKPEERYYMNPWNYKRDIQIK